jgi:hypothetical protein
LVGGWLVGDNMYILYIDERRGAERRKEERR